MFLEFYFDFVEYLDTDIYKAYFNKHGFRAKDKSFNAVMETAYVDKMVFFDY